MKTRRPGSLLIFRLLSIFVGVAFSVALLEVGLRVIDWPSPGLYRGRDGPVALSMANEEGSSWRAYPGRMRLRHWDYDVEIELNSDGFIERERTSKRPGTWRVGLFGDSFVAGMGVASEDRFGRIWMNAIYPSEARPIEIYNFGSAWCGTGQNAAFLSAHAAEYELDEVVLALFGGNEIEDNLRWSSYRALPQERQVELDREASSGRTLRTWIRNHSRAAGFLYVAIASRFTTQEIGIPTKASLDKGWAKTRQALESFALEAGIRPVTIWYLPDSHEWDDDVWSELRGTHHLEETDRHVVRDAVEAWANAQRIPFVDVTPMLEGRTIDELRFRRDGHWNADGHRVVGLGLARIPLASFAQRRNDAESD